MNIDVVYGYSCGRAVATPRDASSKFDVGNFRRQMRDNSAAVAAAAGRNFAAGPGDHSCFFTESTSTKEPGDLRRGAFPLDYANGRPSEAARTAGCAVAKRKPQTGGIFFFHEDTNNAFRSPTVLPPRARRRWRHRHGRKGMARGSGSKYNQIEE